MINEGLKSNLELREVNKNISDKYEKERAKVYQLNFELERKKRSQVAKPKLVTKIAKSGKQIKLRTPDNYSKFLNGKQNAFKPRVKKNTGLSSSNLKHMK